MHDIKTIIVSDLHLGNPFSNWRQLENFLKENPCDNLFLNGDIIDEHYLIQNHKKLSEDELDFFNWMAHLDRTKVIYIVGNHEDCFIDLDFLSVDNIPWDKYKVRVYNDFMYRTNKSIYYISHGHHTIFKNPISGNKNVLRFIDSAIRFLAKLRKTHAGFIFQSGELDVHKGVEFSILSKVSRKFFKLGLKTISRYRGRIREYTNFFKIRGVICGHIHQPEIHKDYKYMNSGDWLENNTALVEKTNGEWEIIKYEK